MSKECVHCPSSYGFAEDEDGVAVVDRVPVGTAVGYCTLGCVPDAAVGVVGVSMAWEENVEGILASVVDSDVVGTELDSVE